MVMVKEAQAKYLSTDIEEQTVLERGVCPDGYKLTEVGMIPDDWEVKGFKEISFMKGRIGWQGLKQSEFTMNSDEPFLITGMNFKDGDIRWDEVYHVSEERYQVAKEIQLKVDDILMTKDGTIGKLLYVKYIPHPNKATLNSHLLVFRPINRSYVPLYLYYNLSSPFFIGHIELHKSGTTFFGISQESVSKYNVLLPPIREQTAIANALSDVDALISSLEKLIAKKQAIKTATMQQLLTGKKRLPGFGEGKGYKQTELGEIPEDWEVDRIGNILSITTGDKNTQDRIDEGNYPFYVRSQAVERINSYSFDGEAVLTAGDGVGTGKIFHYIQGKFDFHQRVYLMSNFNERIDGFYFFKYFSNHFYDRIMSMTAKSSVDSVRREMIADMLIALPLIDEQREIAKVLSEMDSEIHLLENRLTKTQQIKQGMMQELLTGKTRLVETKARDKYDR